MPLQPGTLATPVSDQAPTNAAESATSASIARMMRSAKIKTIANQLVNPRFSQGDPHIRPTV